MADCPRLRTRNLLWLLLHRQGRLAPAEIARAVGVTPATVRRGLAAAAQLGPAA